MQMTSAQTSRFRRLAAQYFFGGIGSAREQTKALRRSEANLAEAQRLSRRGRFGGRVSNGEILWSEETFRIFQYDRTTRPTVELIVQRTHPEDRALVQRTIERASQDGKDFDFEHRLLMPDGSIKHLHVIGHAEGDKCGGCEFIGAVMDVTAAKEAEEKIRQNERELRITLETIPTFVVSTLADGAVDFASQSWLDYLGRSREEILGWSWMQVVHPEDLDTLLNSWQMALAAGEPLETEARIRRADGEYRWFLARAVPLSDEKGNVVKWYATTHDIDDRKQAEQKLRQSEAYLSEAQRLSLTGSGSWNVASGEIFWSDETFRIFQCDRTTKPTLELIRQRTHPEDRALVQQTMERASQDGKDIDFEHRLLMPDGSVKYVHVVSHPVFNSSGDLVEYVGTVMDVTEHKQVAEVLRKSKNRFKAMVEKNAEGILLILPDKRIIYASPAVERVLGYTSEELTMQSLIEHVHPDYRQHATDSWNRLLDDQ